MTTTASQYPVLYEDADILVINKPAGVVVNRADTTKEPTVQDWLTTQLPIWEKASPRSTWEQLIPADFSMEFGTPEAIFTERLGIAHRLDKDTSGALMIAKNPGALVVLLQQFRDRHIQKTYTCLVHGGFAVPEGEISAPLGRSRQDRMKYAVTIDGRLALTAYKVSHHFGGLVGLVKPEKLGADVQDSRYQGLLAQFAKFPLKTQKTLRLNKDTYEQGFSLVECQPKTGRTHQIRVHLAHIHHPIVGDETYVGKKRAQLDSLWCSRQFLHAAQIMFTQPRTGERVTVAAPLPEDLQKVLSWLVEW